MMNGGGRQREESIKDFSSCLSPFSSQIYSSPSPSPSHAHCHTLASAQSSCHASLLKAPARSCVIPTVGGWDGERRGRGATGGRESDSQPAERSQQFITKWQEYDTIQTAHNSEWSYRSFASIIWHCFSTHKTHSRLECSNE